MSGNRREMVKRTSSKKGFTTTAAGVGAVALFAFGPWWLGVAALVGTGYLAYDWLRYRGKWGMRF